eukprot:Platyproteum_vivax@DN6354_c0_g1_i1.p1
MTALLHVVFEGQTCGAIDIDEESTLSTVRQQIEQDGLPVPKQFVFEFAGAPVTLKQEGRRPAVECMPAVTIIVPPFLPETSAAPQIDLEVDDENQLQSTGVPSSVMSCSPTNTAFPSIPMSLSRDVSWGVVEDFSPNSSPESGQQLLFPLKLDSVKQNATSCTVMGRRSVRDVYQNDASSQPTTPRVYTYDAHPNFNKANPPTKGVGSANSTIQQMDEPVIEVPHHTWQLMNRVQVQLTVVDGPSMGSSVILPSCDPTRKEFGIGRHAGNALVITEPSVSRFHSVVAHQGVWPCVKDLQSTTGTFIFLVPFSSTQLFTGMFLRLGECLVEVVNVHYTPNPPTPFEDENTPYVTLRFFQGQLENQLVKIGPLGAHIGRRKQKHDVETLVIAEDPTISSKHCRIELHPSNKLFYITDLGSCNGTAVRLCGAGGKASGWHPLLPKDMLAIGSTKIRCTIISDALPPETIQM